MKIVVTVANSLMCKMIAYGTVDPTDPSLVGGV